MNPQDPLANLHPLREPELIGWWPLAPGWWLLLAMLVMCLLGLIYLLLRRYRANAYRRQALLQLREVQQRYLDEGDVTGCLSQINALLKSVALQAYPRRGVAGSSGEQWLAFLNSRVKRSIDFPPGFVQAHYHKNAAELDLEQVQRAAQQWIRHHEVAR
jgi:hypothetical protein